MAELSGASNTGSKPYLYFVTVVAAVGGLLFGFDIGVISGALPFIKQQFILDVFQEGFVVGILLLGSVVGASLAGALTDKYGRKRILIFSALLFTVSAIACGLPRTITELSIARFFAGIAVGLASVLSPVYIAEIAPPTIRGKLVAINQFAIVIGIFMTYLTNWMVVDMGPNNWRFMFAIAAVPAGFFFFALFFVPESPRWLTKQNRGNEALGILTRISGVNLAEIAMKEIKESMAIEEGSLRELLKPGFRKALIVGIIMAVLSQFCGMNTIVYFAPEIFMKAGFEQASSALLAQVLVGFVNFIFTIVAIMTMDKLGRRFLLLVGFVGMTVSFIFTGWFFNNPDVGGKIIILPILTYVAFFCMSVGAVTWVLLSEIFPTKIRGRAMGIATMSLWVACYILSQTFPWLISTIGGNSFYLYAGICAIGFVFALMVVPETKNKTLEEIEHMWLGKH